MAGALTISTLNDSSGVLATQNGMSGIAKAWVNFNGVTTATIRGSFNVSSVTRNGTGDYTINYTTAMPDANYAATIGFTNRAPASGTSWVVGYYSSGGVTADTYSTTQLRVLVKVSSNGAAEDNGNICITVSR